MPPHLRKFALTIHLTTSVGWIGAVIVYLAAVISAMNRQDVQHLRAAWIVMDVIGWYAIVPMAVISLLTGLIMSLGTKWGLFRHYWVLFSLALTIFAIVVLIQHMPTVSHYAGMAKVGENADVDALRSALNGELFHGGIGLLVLLVIQVLNVYKPRGLTPYGWRKQYERRSGSPTINAVK